MNLSELGKGFIETSRHTKSGAIALFIGGVLTTSGVLAVGECFQNGNYELALRGIPITAGEGATSLLIAGVAQKIEVSNKQKVYSKEGTSSLEVSNFSEPDSKNLV